MLDKLTPIEIAALKTSLLQAIDKNDIDAASLAIEKLDVDDLAFTNGLWKQTPLHLALRICEADCLSCEDTIAILLINNSGLIN